MSNIKENSLRPSGKKAEEEEKKKVNWVNYDLIE